MNEELRKGNLIYRIDRSSKIHIPEGLPIRVTSILESDVNGYIRKDLESKDLCYVTIRNIDISPIPISEEWLLHFGFTKVVDYVYCDKSISNVDVFILEIKNNTYMVSYTEYGYAISLIEWKNIKATLAFKNYIHELQNVFFALTGVELKRGGNGS